MSTTYNIERYSDARIRSTTTLDKSKFLHDSIIYLRGYLNANVTDPLAGSREGSFIFTSWPEKPVQYPNIVIYRPSAPGALISIGQASKVYTVAYTIDVYSLNTKERDELTDEVLYALHNGFSSFSSYKMEFAGIGNVFDNPTGARVGASTIHRETVETRWKIYII